MQSDALAQELELEQALALQNARADFVSYCATVDPTWVPNWHHMAICDAIQFAIDRKTPRQLLRHFGHSDEQIKQMMAERHPVTKLYGGMTRPEMVDEPITGLQFHVGPRMGKSQIVSRLLPPYFLGRFPRKHVIAASHTAALAEEMNDDVQNIMDGDGHLAVFPDARIANPMIERGTRTRKRFTVANYRGSYRGAGVGGNVVGRSGHLIVLDDCVRGRQQAESDADTKKVQAWYRADIYTRRELDTIMIILNTRWSLKDISAYTLAVAQNDATAQQFFCLIFPSILSSDAGPADPRELGESVWPSRFPLRELAKIRATSLGYEWESQHQQNPVSPEGSLIKNAWVKYYERLPGDLVSFTISVDLTFKDRKDYCAFEVWAAQGANRYLVDLIQERLDFNEQLHVFEGLCRQYPQATVKLVEDAANGAALIAKLNQNITGIVPIKPKTSKINRVMAVAPQFQAGNVFIPAPHTKPWVDKFVRELTAFPGAEHDDMVDSASMALCYMEQQAISTKRLTALSIGRPAPPNWTPR